LGVITQRTCRHYIGADADKASIPVAALTAGDIFEATDTGYFYVWSGAAWVWPVPNTSITAAQLAADAVETLKIKDLNVTAGKLATDAVETLKIKDLNVTAGKLATDAVETAKIKNLNVTTGKAALGFGRYVPVVNTGWDFVVGDFTTNGAWQVDGLDLSAIVPAGATAAILLLGLTDDAAASALEIRKNATQTVSDLRQDTQVANVAIYTQGIVALDADRLVDYYGDNLAFVGIDICVLGYFI